MGAFRFEAVDAAGSVERGVLQADSARQCRSVLRGRGLVPVAIEEMAASRTTRADAAGRPWPTAELAFVTRQLAVLLDAAIPVEQALGTLLDQVERPRTREVLAQVRAAVMEGRSLEKALEAFPRVFPEVYRALVAAGEASGELGAVLERLADHLESRQALRAKVVGALLYPAVLSVVAFAAVCLVMIYVVPQVTRVFEGARQQLPWITRALIGASEALRTHGIWLPAAAAGAVVAARRHLARPEARRRWDERLLRVPGLGRLLLTADVARFSAALSILVGGGVPMLPALHAARAAVASPTLRDAIDQAARQVQEGAPLSRALSARKRFPPLFLQLVANGEATGRLPDLLDRAARQQRLDLDRRVAIAATLLEPGLILVAGVAVLAIVVAIFLPMIEAQSLLR